MLDERKTASAGAVAADLVRAYGVDHFFLLTGGDNSFLLELRDRKVDLVLARSERSSAFMADAYARVSGKPTFVYGQFGPGAMVVLSGLIDALYGKSPVIALASETSRSEIHRFAYQELDQLALFRPIVKWGARVERADRLPDLFRTAVREAVTGVAGPTYLGVPTDLLVEGLVEPLVVYAEEACLRVNAYRVRPDPRGIEAIAAAVSSADRPLLLAGSGVISSEAWDEVTALAEAYSLPVVTSAGGKGAIAETHYLAHGVTGRYSRVSANALVRRSDFLIVVGSRLSDMTTNRERTILPDARVAHVDADPSALGRTRHDELAVVGDAKLTLAALAAALEGHSGWQGWAREAAAVTADWMQRRTSVEARTGEHGLSPTAVIRALREALGQTDVVVADTGHMAAWTAALYDVPRAGVQHVRTAGSLGWALPASLGAQLARPNDRVVCVIGDGGIGYHLADLETAVRRNLPVVVVLMNNGTLGFEYQVQRKRLGRVDPSFIDFGEVDYAAIARACGAGGRKVERHDEIEPAVEAALATERPFLLDVAIDRGADAPVTNFEDLEEREL
jgi:acetolactate synthase I/II/III large subunit